MNKIIFALTLLVISFGGIAYATPAPKYFVCKYVRTPGGAETLKEGLNPISVNANALTPPIVIGQNNFADAQERTFVVALDIGQEAPSCTPGQDDPGDDDPEDPGDDTPDTPTDTPVTPETPVVTPTVAPTPAEEVEVFQGK